MEFARFPYEDKMREQTEDYVKAVLAAHPEWRKEPPVQMAPVPEPEPEPQVVVVSYPDSVDDLLEIVERDFLPAPRQLGKMIIKAVAQKHLVTVKEMLSDRRDKHLAMARQEACYELRARTELSTPQIGRLLNRDHSTVLHGCRRHEARLMDRVYEKTRNNVYPMPGQGGRPR